LAFIQRGELIAVGSPETLKETMMAGRVFEIQPADTFKTVEILRTAMHDPDLPINAVELYGSFVHVIVQDEKTRAEDIERILQHHNLSAGSIREIEPSLEDVFIACMREDD
jgi:ABC-type multidrug transport system ATPase subunit